jgi:aromatic ring-opening dioxygenase LigB subunit
MPVLPVPDANNNRPNIPVFHHSIIPLMFLTYYKVGMITRKKF